MNVFQTISAVKADLGAVDKNGKMEGFGQSYKFRGIDDVINALHVPLHTHGLVIAPRLRSITQEHEQGNKKNQTRTLVEFEWTIAGPEGDSFVAATSGEAMDTQDKGSNKAGTAAFKQLLTQLLAIPFETDDPDNYQPNPPEAAAKPAAKPAASKPAPPPSAVKQETPPAPAGERVCPACECPIGTNDAIKKVRGVINHKACVEGKSDMVASTDPNDISAIISTFGDGVEVQ